MNINRRELLKTIGLSGVITSVPSILLAKISDKKYIKYTCEKNMGNLLACSDEITVIPDYKYNIFKKTTGPYIINKSTSIINGKHMMLFHSDLKTMTFYSDVIDIGPIVEAFGVKWVIL